MSLISWLYGGDQIQAQSDALDQQLADLNAQKQAAGTWTPEQYQQVLADQAAGHQDVNAAINTGFDQGLAEGAANEVAFVTQTVPGAINATLSATVGAFFKAIPISVWLIGAVALFVWLGGLSYLRGTLNKK